MLRSASFVVLTSLFLPGLLSAGHAAWPTTPEHSVRIPEVTFGASTSGCLEPPAPLISLWSGEADGADATGNHPGILVGEPEFVSGNVGNAFRLDGVDDHVRTDLVLPASGTISFWVNPDQLPSAMALLGTASSDPDDRFWVGVSASRLLINLGNRFVADLDTPNPLSVGAWTHVAVTWDYDADRYHLFIDGELEDESTVDRSRPTGALVLGLLDASFSSSQPLDGLLDEVTVFDRALGAEEVRAIFEADSAGVCLPDVSCEAPSDEDLVASWPGEDDGGDAAGDHDGDLEGGIGFEAGQVGRAFRFDGLDDRMRTDLILPSSGTLSFWTNPAEQPESMAILGTASTDPDDRFWVGVRSSRLLVNLGSRFVADLDIPNPLSVGAWSHVAVTWDYGADAYRLYVDGELRDESSAPRSRPTRFLNVGFFEASFGQSQPFSGLVDEIAVYGRPLAAGEIRSLAAAGTDTACDPDSRCVPPPAELLGWWPGEENGLDIAAGHDGDLQNGTGFGEGQVGRAFALDGLNDRIIVDDEPAFDLAGPFSVHVWLFSAGAPGNYQGILNKGYHTAGPFEVRMTRQFDPLSRGLGCSDQHALFFGVNTTLGRAFAASCLTKGQWHHVVGTWDGSSVRLYVDGELVGGRSLGGRLITNNLPVSIGWNGSFGEYWAGRLDEPAIFGRALSASEVKALFEAGSAGMCRPGGTADREPPTILDQSLDFDAGTLTLSGVAEFDEVGELLVVVGEDADGPELLSEVFSTTASEPFEAPFELTVPSPPPPLARVELGARDLAGNTVDGITLLLDTSVSLSGGGSGATDPDTGVTIRVEGVALVTASADDEGRPVAQLSGFEGGTAEVVFTLTEAEDLSLCGSSGSCILSVDGETTATTRRILAGGTVEYVATVPAGGRVTTVLRFDERVGGAGVSGASDPVTGTSVVTAGDVVQTTVTGLGGDLTSSVTTGDTGGPVTISFTLTEAQDLERCGGVPDVCAIVLDRTERLPTKRQLPGDGRVRYIATVTLAPGSVHLFSLQAFDGTPPSAGELVVSVPFVRSGEPVVLEVVLTDDSRVVVAECRFLLPDGRVVVLPLERVTEEEDLFRVRFTPPPSPVDGRIEIEVVAEDVAGNVTRFTPPTSGSSSLLLDNTEPRITLPPQPIVAPRFFEGVPVVRRGGCIQLTVSVVDAISGVEEVQLEVSGPDGTRLLSVTGGEAGTFTGEICLSVEATGGPRAIQVIARDRAGNRVVVPCDLFVVNDPPIVAAGQDRTIDEGEAVTLNGMVEDPDPGDSPSVRWTFGDGTGIADTLSPSHVYGDNGEFLVTLTATDDLGASAADSLQVTVRNLPPELSLTIAAIEELASGPALLLRRGESFPFEATATDPGSDDLVFTWSWGDGTPDTVHTHFNDGQGADPPLSPAGELPFSASDSAGHAYALAGIYGFELEVTDDDGGTDRAEIAVLVSGERTHLGDLRGLGFWKHQVRGRGRTHADPAMLEGFFEVIRFASAVFGDTVTLDGLEAARTVLDLRKASMRQRATQHLLVAWLNLARGGAALNTAVDIDGDGVPESRFGEVLEQVEAVLLDAEASRGELEAAKDLAERLSQGND